MFFRVHINDNDSPTKDKSMLSTQNVTDIKTDDSIVDDILSVEDEYSILNAASAQTHSEMLNIANYSRTHESIAAQIDDRHTDTLMQMEFLKEMNQLHSLDDELFYNDIDFDSFQTNQVFNPNDIDYRAQDRNGEILFDFADCTRSIDQDLMNALYQVKAADELLNVPAKESAFPTNTGNLLPDSVTVNDCATIFESDVDLEASSNLAMNLNQLIGENSVHYVSTEDDDTFIISLDSAIDAEKLSDLLNIEVETMESSEKEQQRDNKSEEVDANDQTEHVPELQPIVITVDAAKISEHKQQDIETVEAIVIEAETIENIQVETEKLEDDKQKKVLSKEAPIINEWICKICKKTFKKRDNYKSHLGKLRDHVM